MSTNEIHDRLGRTSRRRFGIIFVVATMLILVVTVVSVLMMAGSSQTPIGLRHGSDGSSAVRATSARYQMI